MKDMKKFEEMTREERDEVVLLFTNWLKQYSHEVICRVMVKRDEIINNEFAMNLLRELKERQEEEFKDFNHSIENLLENFDTFKEFNPHSHPLTHAGSYRDILHDMYIK